MNTQDAHIQVLGTAQDGGYPQMGCQATCCSLAWTKPSTHRSPCSIAIVDPASKSRWLIDCTPHFGSQWNRLNEHSSSEWGVSGIFLTHAHIGHYVGLVNLGKEVLCTSKVDVYAMPKMESFLRDNHPWSGLIKDQNIIIRPLAHQVAVSLSDQISITPLLVPHRDEYSETVGFRIATPHKQVLYISDIDHWNIDSFSIEQELEDCDLAWLDGTFYSAQELPHRIRSDIPHPTVLHTMDRFKHLSEQTRSKIHFTHLNHSNPLCNPDAPEHVLVRAHGYQIAQEDRLFCLV